MGHGHELSHSEPGETVASQFVLKTRVKYLFLPIEIFMLAYLAATPCV